VNAVGDEQWWFGYFGNIVVWQTGRVEDVSVASDRFELLTLHLYSLHPISVVAVQHEEPRSSM
jgi:hypothetical protein